MPSYARREIVAEGEVGIYHCMARCVRRAFLCGRDPLTGRDYEHRKGWIRRRLEFLAGAFALDVCGFAAMGNHLHVVLRTRPDLSNQWSDEEIARRWWRLFPRRRDEHGGPAEPEAHELKVLMESPPALAERRKRLASLSWFMRALCEPIARRANRDDECGGRFWEGRFKCQALLDDAAVLACSLYVDLNPIRSGIAATPETSTHTSAFDRIAARQARLQLGKQRQDKHRQSNRTGRAKGRNSRQAAPAAEPQDGWLCPVSVGGETHSPAKQTDSGTLGRRASDRGFLPLDLDVYLRLLDWTGRQVRRDKRGAIPADLQPILERLCVNGETLVETVRQFGHWFHRAVGRSSNMASRAAAAGRRWFQGVRHSQAAFT